MSRYDDARGPGEGPGEEEIARILALPEDDPERRRWESDPRHRAIARGYGAFLGGDEGDVRQVARSEEAAAAMQQSLRRALGAQPSKPFPVAARWAMAAVLALAVGVGAYALKPSPSPVGEPSGVLRGSSPSGFDLDLWAAEIGAEGALALSWSEVAAADSYEVRLYDAQLTEVLRRSVEVNSLTVPAAELGALAAPPALWSVRALAGTSRLAESEVAPLRH